MDPSVVKDLLLEARIWAMEATLRRLEKLLERRGC